MLCWDTCTKRIWQIFLIRHEHHNHIGSFIQKQILVSNLTKFVSQKVWVGPEIYVLLAFFYDNFSTHNLITSGYFIRRHSSSNGTQNKCFWFQPEIRMQQTMLISVALSDVWGGGGFQQRCHWRCPEIQGNPNTRDRAIKEQIVVTNDAFCFVMIE